MPFLKKVGRAFARTGKTIVKTTTHTGKNVIYETSKVFNQVGHELEKGGKKLEKTTKEVIKAPEKAVNKLTRARVRKNINKVFEKQMQEAINNLQKDLEQRKVQDKAVIDQAIKDTIQEATDEYLNLTSKNVLDEIEIEFIEVFSFTTAAIHDCRLGYKEIVEEILTLNCEYEAFSKFMEEYPLRLALQDLREHQRTEALEVLILYFAKNLNNNKLSTENINDFLCLQNHVLKTVGNGPEKEEEVVYYSKMVQIIACDASAGIIKASKDGIIINILTNDDGNIKDNKNLVDQDTNTTKTILEQLNSTQDLTDKPSDEKSLNNISKPNDHVCAVSLDDEFEQATVFYKDLNYNEAILKLKKIIEIDSTFVKAYKLCGRCYSFSGQTQLALECYNRAIELDPSDAQLFYYRSLVYKKLDDYENCLRDLEKYLQMNGENICINDWYDKIKQKYTHLVQGQLDQVTLLFQDKNYTEALIKVTEVLNLYPNCAAAHTLCGKCFYYTGQIKQALASYNRAIELDSKNAFTFYYRSYTFYKLNDLDHCLQDIEKYMQMNGVTQRTRDRYERVKKEQLEQKLKEANSLYQDQNYEQALAKVKDVISSDPNSVKAHKLSANCYYESGQIQQAITAYSHAIELNPHNPHIFFRRAYAFEKLGDLTKCSEDIEKYIQLKLSQ